MDDTLRCFGLQNHHESDNFPIGVKFKSISAGGAFTCGIQMDDTLRYFGDESRDQRKDFPTGIKFKAISSGNYHTCGILMDDTLRCFGQTAWGQRESFPTGVKFKSISAGHDHTCGIQMDGTLMCFGDVTNNRLKDLKDISVLLLPDLEFLSFELGLVRLQKYVYPESIQFVRRLTTIVSELSLPKEYFGLFSPLLYHKAMSRLLAYNYLMPFLTSTETDFIASRVLPLYLKERKRWNEMADVTSISDIDYSPGACAVSFDFLIASLEACKPLVADEKLQSELGEILTELGTLKAAGQPNPELITSLLKLHEPLLSSLHDNPSTKGFAGVVKEVKSYLTAKVHP